MPHILFLSLQAGRMSHVFFFFLKSAELRDRDLSSCPDPEGSRLGGGPRMGLSPGIGQGGSHSVGRRVGLAWLQIANNQWGQGRGDQWPPAAPGPASSPSSRAASP